MVSITSCNRPLLPPLKSNLPYATRRFRHTPCATMPSPGLCRVKSPPPRLAANQDEFTRHSFSASFHETPYRGKEQIMEQFFKDPQTLLRLHEGPLGPFIESFAERLTDQGYARYSIRYQLRLVANFSRWLQQQRVTVNDLRPEHIGCYLQQRAQQRRIREGDAFALQRFLDILRQEGVVPEKKALTVPTPAELLADEFRSYLRQERTLAQTTVTFYLEFISRFLQDRFTDG